MGGEPPLNYLLDTHVWIWAALEPKKLSSPARRILEDAGSLLYVSPISCWEVAMLQDRGRIDLPTTAEAWVKDALNAPGIEVAAFTSEIAVLAARLSMPFHGDPADRFLTATAIHTGIPFITADRRILEYEPVRTLW